MVLHTCVRAAEMSSCDSSWVLRDRVLTQTLTRRSLTLNVLVWSCTPPKGPYLVSSNQHLVPFETLSATWPPAAPPERHVSPTSLMSPRQSLAAASGP